MLQNLIHQILEETRYGQNPYFVHLKDGAFSRDDFLETQIQFYWAVVFFNRPMAMLAAKIPTAELRKEVLRNVWEEHGEGDLSSTHGMTFLELLSRLGGVTPKDVERRALWPEVRIFNTTLTGACTFDEYLTGVGMMGIIERMFCDISCWIGRGIVERGWLTRDRMIHYNLHEELDVRHSQDFFDILEPSWKKSAEDRYYIEQGLRLGATLFNDLYEGLYRSRQRRLLRQITGPHSRAAGGL